jgi:hypothetical protein
MAARHQHEHHHRHVSDGLPHSADAAIEGASNTLIDIEDLDEHELTILHKHYQLLALRAQEDGKVAASHSVEEAEHRHAAKRRRWRQAREGTEHR